MCKSNTSHSECAAPYGGQWIVSSNGCLLASRQRTSVSLGQGARWVLDAVCMRRETKISSLDFAVNGIFTPRLSCLQPSHYTDWAKRSTYDKAHHWHSNLKPLNAEFLFVIRDSQIGSLAGWLLTQTLPVMDFFEDVMNKKDFKTNKNWPCGRFQLCTTLIATKTKINKDK
jgi:hypothetical protein